MFVVQIPYIYEEFLSQKATSRNPQRLRHTYEIHYVKKTCVIFLNRLSVIARLFERVLQKFRF